MRNTQGPACTVLVVTATAALFVAVTVVAQIIAVVPDSWDYGGVEIGSSEPMSFLISNTKVGTVLNVYSVAVVDDDTGSFEIASMSHTLPAELEEGDSMETVVTFTPTVDAMASASLAVASDCDENPLLYVPLQGEGVDVEPTPDEMMDAIMTYYDDAVANYTIWGLGGGNAPAAHLSIFRGMLDAADDLIVAGDYEAACDQLTHAIGKCDGLDAPPDFIGGPGVAPLSSMIGEVMEVLGC